MNTIKTFEDLQELGSNSIHEHTHISRSKIEQLLNKSFGELTRVQVMGFISILEREYQVDLSSLREEYDEYLQSHQDIGEAKQSVILQAQSNTRRLWIIGAFIGIVVLIGIAWSVQGSLSSFPKEEVMELSTSTVKVVEENLSELINADMDLNATDVNETHPLEMKIEENTKDTDGIDFGPAIGIKPTYKVWVGMMNLDTGIKSQKVTDAPIMFDTTKKWLFVFGHGRIEIIAKDKNTTMKEKNNVWFVYENGKLTQLTHDQFRAKNRGENW